MKVRIRMNLLRAGLLTLLLLLFSTMPAYAQEPAEQTVRVAYFDMGDYYQEQSAGNVASYDTEALQEIEEYSDLRFEYVNCGTWARALEMLERHEVDLVGTVQWTSEREQAYEFCLESYGYTVGELAALVDRHFAYEDYEAIGNAVIGTTGNYVRMQAMKDMFREHNINPTIKTYEGQTELERALESGEIDLVAANSHTLKEEWTVVEKFSYAPFYLVSWKGNAQLTDKIDDAIISINLRKPEWDDELLKKYFPSIVGAPLTKEELDLIAKNKTYDVYFNTNTKPTSWFDEETQTMQGGLVDVCKQITAITGLKLNPVPSQAGETDSTPDFARTTTLFSEASSSFSNTPGVTEPLINELFNLYYNEKHKVDLDQDSYTIAIVVQRENLKSYIHRTYPKATIVEYNAPLECLQAVERADADLTYLDCRIAENAILENDIQNVREFPIDPDHQGIALAFSGENAALLESIVNKGLAQVDQTEISDQFVKIALETYGPFTWNDLIREYLVWLLVGAFVLVLLLVSVASLYTYARVMKQQKDRIAKADADRAEFFARMSHDMRTPMNGILGMIELSQGSGDVKEIHQNLHKAKEAGTYMLSLINDTLDLQRLESQKLQLEHDVVQVSDYYDGIFSILRISAEQRQITFRVHYIGLDMNNYIELDAVRCKQILSNLVSNAIKFTPKGGTIEVTVESLGQEGETLHRKYQVKDTGIGMSEEFIRTRLFKPYAQENNQLSMQLTGSGLGMAITKNLVELMGGRLEVESALGEGTTFTVYLDIKRAAKEEIDRKEKERKERSNVILSDLDGKNILLCEDHPLNAEIATRLLEKVGCTVEWAKNGQQGVDCFANSATNAFDAILMDIRMPVMDGLKAAKAIRKLDRPDAKTVPILAMTANAYRSDIENCLAAGMNAHIAKPIDPQQLYATIDEYLSRREKPE